MAVAIRRHSKYAEAVKRSLAYYGHATNAQMADDIRRSYPHLSDTTVHRITQRLVDDGLAQLAPNAVDGAMVFDSNLAPHDHFECAQCGRLSDISVPADARRQIHAAIGHCRLSGSLKIVGECCDCIEFK